MSKLLASAAIGLGVILSSAHAEAREWWMVDVSKNQCMGPLQQGINPDVFERELRTNNDFVGLPKVDVRDDDAGNTYVEIDTHYRVASQSVSYFFSTTYAGCEKIRQYMVTQGRIIPRSKLQ
jgi:hypothetical protein